MQSTVRHLFLDDLSRSDVEKGAITARGIGMSLEKSTCHDCGKKGHYVRHCKGKKKSSNSTSTETNDKQVNKKSSNMKTGSRDTVVHKWCSVHKTTSHDDAECYAQ